MNSSKFLREANRKIQEYKRADITQGTCMMCIHCTWVGDYMCNKGGFLVGLYGTCKDLDRR